MSNPPYLFSLNRKLVTVLLLIGLLPAALVGYFSAYMAGNVVEQQMINQLESVKGARKRAIEKLLFDTESHLNVLSSTLKMMVQSAFHQLESLATAKRDKIEQRFGALRHQLEIEAREIEARNGALLPLLGQLTALASLRDGAVERQVVVAEQVRRQVAPLLERLALEKGWEDLYLISAEGTIVYSTRRGGELGLSIPRDLSANSGLRVLFNSRNQGGDSGDVGDFSHYPFAEQPLAALMTPLLNREGKVAGYMAAMYADQLLDNLIVGHQWSGVPGEIFLLGEREGVLLYHSGPSLGQSLFRSTLSNELKNHILSGGKDTELYVGSGGHVWVISHTPLRVEGVAWFITTVMEISAVIAPRLGGESGGDDYLTQVITQYGYDDMMMVDPNGDVFYSANQGEEYLSNIFQGVFEGSHLAELVQKVQQTLNYAISDFSPYVGHGLQPAAFAAIPVEIVHRGDDYRRSFVIVLELSLDLINEVMIARTGMGESGESYLVGEDLLLRSDAFNGEGDFTVSSSFETPQSRSINTIPAQRAVAGEHGAMFTSSYDGRSVISSFEAIDLESFHWGLLVEVAEDEALQVVSELNRLSLIVLTVVAVLIILLSRWIASGISRPIIKTSDLMKRVAETGDFSERLPILQQDEIGQMAESMNRLLIHLQSAFFRLKTVYDASNEGILIVANDGRVLDANRRFSKIWELPEPIVEQHAVQELIRMMMSRLKGSQEFLRTTEATIGSVESKASALLAFNDGRMVTCHSRPHWVHDQVEGRIWNFYDVTEEWSAIHAKDDFLASMSHELRTPLTAIIGNCELLSEMETDPDKRQLIRAIDVSGRGQLALVNDILDLSKIESGKFTIDESPYDLNLLVQDILQMFSTRVEDAGLWFELEQPRTFPHPLVGDKHRIAQVLINLIGNAIKFTQQGHITLKVWRADTQLCFSVEDSGIGMSAEIIGRLFQRFEQADSSTSRRFGGSGLGLYISKGLTDLMGGTIEVESEVKVGSKFLLRLPYTEGAPVLSQEDKQEGEKEKRGASLKGAILVAEDTPELQLLVRRILESMGVSVAVADNGKEAVELATAQSFDLILMDMQMPVMDGIEATKMLRSQGSSVPIVALTANVMQKHQDAFNEAGCNGFLSKPIDRQALRQMISPYLRAQ